MKLSSISKIAPVEITQHTLTVIDRRSRNLKRVGWWAKWLNRIGVAGHVGYLTLSHIGSLVLNHKFTVGPYTAGLEVLIEMCFFGGALCLLGWLEMRLVEFIGKAIGHRLLESHVVDHDRFIEANRSRVEGLNQRIEAFNARLEVTTQNQALLNAQSADDFEEMVAGLVRRRVEIVAERDAFKEEERIVLAPFVEREAIFKDAAAVEAMLHAYEESARGAKTLDYTSVSMALRARDTLIERAAAIGIGEDELPAIPRGLVPKQLTSAS